MNELIVALGEYDTGWHNPVQSLSRAREQARHAREHGARLLVLPEMCATGFTMEPSLAELPDGPSVKALSSIAADNDIAVLAGIAMNRDGRNVNSALVFDRGGSLIATYDKRRLFDFARENTVYSPGSASCVVEIDGVSLAIFICFELRFPELFRETRRDVDAFVVIANWPAARQRHWEVLTQARAIENQCYLIAVNRLGEADGLTYTGGSVILDPRGERIDVRTGDSPVRTGTITRSVVQAVREAFPLTPPASR